MSPAAKKTITMEENEIPADVEQAKADEAAAQQLAEVEADQGQASEEFIEYVGTSPYGVEYEDRRIISRRDAKLGWDISIPKDMVWEKRASGQYRGRMLLPVADLNPEVLENLVNEPGFKRVTLS